MDEPEPLVDSLWAFLSEQSSAQTPLEQLAQYADEMDMVREWQQDPHSLYELLNTMSQRIEELEDQLLQTQNAPSAAQPSAHAITCANTNGHYYFLSGTSCHAYQRAFSEAGGKWKPVEVVPPRKERHAWVVPESRFHLLQNQLGSTPLEWIRPQAILEQ